MQARIYVDASVIGGCEDDEFSEHSLKLLERFVRGECVLVVSNLTVQELAAAPEQVRQHLASVPEAHIETLQLGTEARELAEAYITARVITGNMRADAQHIAMATVARVDVLVSWNFKHIVNLRRIHGYNSVNLRLRFGRHGRCCQMSRTEKKFDAVDMMRSIRDRISAEIEGMTLEEELAWPASQEIRDPFLKRLRDRAAHRADSAGDAPRHR